MTGAALSPIPGKTNTITVSMEQSGSLELAYREIGEGTPVLFLHEFASASHTWEKMLPFLNPGHRLILLDLAGFGHSSALVDNPLTLPQHAEIVGRFIGELGLRDLVLVGHGMGGEIALCLMNSPDARANIRKLVLISCGIPTASIPDYIRNIGQSSMTKPIVRLIHSGFVARALLEYFYAPHHPLDPNLVSEYAALLKESGRPESIIAAARVYSHPASLPALSSTPVAILAGDEDPILPVSLAERLHEYYPVSSLSFLSGCGHLPQEECPRETAAILNSVFSDGAGRPPEKVVPSVEDRKRVPRMRRLFDYWNAGTVLLILILKILQFFRKLGIKVERQSWRKVTGVFLQREYSKFVIGAFRLRTLETENLEKARESLRERLQEFLISRPELHLTEEIRTFASYYKSQPLCDVMTAEVDQDGNLLSITPFFDPRLPVPEKYVIQTLRAVIEAYNDTRESADPNRSRRLKTVLRKTLLKRARFRPLRRRVLLGLAERILSGTYLFFDGVLPPEPLEATKRRFLTPDLKRYRHPGWGLCGIICRFSADLTEADLWWQFNHVMVDGSPMQEVLTKLKQEWGTVGHIVFPPLNGLISPPEVMDCGDGVFRARFYADFTPLMRLRNSLNRMCLNEMNGKSSFAALIMWGLSRHPYFSKRKMLLPVDFYNADGARQLGLLIMRPALYDWNRKPLDAYCRFQTEMNRKLEETRNGYAESSEFLSLCSMLHPVFYLLTRKVAPKALEEIVGTMGISIIADAEVFVSPLTDFQIDGFMSLGSALIQTMDGRRAGSVCVCGTRDQISLYYDAVRNLIQDLPHLLER